MCSCPKLSDRVSGIISCTGVPLDPQPWNLEPSSFLFLNNFVLLWPLRGANSSNNAGAISCCQIRQDIGMEVKTVNLHESWFIWQKHSGQDKKAIILNGHFLTAIRNKDYFESLLYWSKLGLSFTWARLWEVLGAVEGSTRTRPVIWSNRQNWFPNQYLQAFPPNTWSLHQRWSQPFSVQ